MTQRKTLKRTSEMKLTPPPVKKKTRGRPFQKGNPGKPKGAKDKLPRAAKANFEAVFAKLGGVNGLYNWAKTNKSTKESFYKMYAKMLPTNVDFEGDIPITFVVSDKFMPQKKGEDVK